MERKLNIIGDSHIARVESSNERWPFRGKTTFFSRRGGGITHLQRSVDVIMDRSPSDITLMFIGGNDLDRHFTNFLTDIAQLAQTFAYEMTRLTSTGSIVIYMEQWPRPGARSGAVDFWTAMNYFEYCLEKTLPTNAWIWHWDKQLRLNDYFFSHDGVHCKRERLKKVSRYLGSAAIAAGRMIRCMK